MDWYYAEAGQQRGPVNDAEFERLVQAGTIRGDTLVWRDGMANWQPYAETAGRAAVALPPATTTPAPAAGGEVVCWQCGKMFPQDEVIRLGDAWVCASCKPTYVQRLKEGVSLPGMMEYAGFWIRFAAKFVDGIILRLLGLVLGLAVGAAAARAGSAASQSAIMISYALGTAIDIAYRTLFVGAFGATPGKMAAKIKIVNADGSKVSYLKALARSLAEFVSVILLFVGYLMVAFDSEKRALHDRMCGTRVIKNPS